MTRKHRIIAALLHVYPAAWRTEYGSELADILIARPLNARIVVNVVWNGFGQRGRVAAASTICGLAAMLATLAGLVWNIAAPERAASGLGAVLEHSSKLLPTVIAAPLASDPFALFVIGCACWTVLRDHSTVTEAGKAAMKVCFMAGLPIMLAGFLMLVGVLDVVVLSPGDPAATMVAHGFAYTYYSAQHHALSPLAVVAAPLFKLPASWVLGMVGGQVGRRILRGGHRQTAG